MSEKISIFWFRRDLRLEDNVGLYYALQDQHPVLPLFIFDRDILDKLEDKQDRRVEFIHQEIARIKRELSEVGSDILVRYGFPLEIFKELSQKFELATVYTNHDYEPYAKARDEKIKDFLAGKNIGFRDFQDQTIFEGRQILTGSDKPYTVYTPYSKKWKSTFEEEQIEPYDTRKHFDQFIKKYSPNQSFEHDLISLEEMGFQAVGKPFPGREIPEKIVKAYDQKRNFPAIEGTTRLSVHLRFGTVSIRQLVKKARELNQVWLNELIWRDFYMMILDNYPKVVDTSYREEYDQIPWRNDEGEFEAWCQGQTGYPIVDAGMRELNETGYMHNRVRMITASFLTKHLLIDWRWGEAYFGKKLLDYELASNNGGWQWAAGSGVDAAPYFRIFNPYTQVDKFDKDRKYIKHWVPEVDEPDYPEAIVEHKAARERCLETYKQTLNN